MPEKRQAIINEWYRAELKKTVNMAGTEIEQALQTAVQLISPAIPG